MKPLVSTSAIVEVLVALVALGVARSVGLDRSSWVAAGVGVGVATLMGLAVLLVKGRAASLLPPGPGGLKALLSMQVLSLGSRLAAVLVGGLWVKQLGFEPVAYVLAFFACYVAQQVIELRYVLEVSKARHAVEARVMKQLVRFVVAMLALALLAVPALASSGGHGEEHGGPKDKASESSEFILHHVADDTEFEFELPFVHLPAIHIAEWFGKEPGQGLYIERVPGACTAPVEASQKAFESLFRFINGCWDLRPTKAVLSMWLAMGLLALVLFLGRTRDQNGVPKGLFANVVESLVLFVRDEIAVANIGKEQGPRYTPYLVTVFFFVASMNYLGLIPGFFTATGVLGVTIALSVVTFIMTQVAGLRSAGVVGFFAHLFGDVPVWIKPLMFLVEFLGLFTKPFALLVRLFANMLAGHMVLFFILSLIFVVHLAASVVSVPLATGLYLLELFVAILQAYIFTLLTALFIGQGVALGHHHHGDGHAH